MERGSIEKSNEFFFFFCFSFLVVWYVVERRRMDGLNGFLILYVKMKFTADVG